MGPLPPPLVAVLVIVTVIVRTTRQKVVPPARGWVPHPLSPRKPATYRPRPRHY